MEAALVKQDLQRAKINERQNAPSAVARALQANEAAMQKRRGRMMLPAPQITDAELEQLARQGEHAVAMDATITGGWAGIQGGWPGWGGAVWRGGGGGGCTAGGQL
jgi:pre-mRNA-splicing factor CDC5/CEF1